MQRLELALDYIPYDVVIDNVVPVDEDVAERDDPRRIGQFRYNS